MKSDFIITENYHTRLSECIAKFLNKKFSEIDYGESDERSESDLFDETIMLNTEENQVYSYDLDEGGKINGKIKSDQPINVFVVSNYGLRRFEKDEEFDYEDGGERIKRIKIDFETYKGGTWHVIIENEESNEAEVDVYLNSK
jgi:hypothetical protein